MTWRSPGVNLKNVSISKAVSSRGNCFNPKNVACQVSRKQRLRDPDGEDFVCHVPSPLNCSNSVEIAPPANAQQTQYLTLC
jgi:hypothetical protein